jgi:hypothetical protein
MKENDIEYFIRDENLDSAGKSLILKKNSFFLCEIYLTFHFLYLPKVVFDFVASNDN